MLVDVDLHGHELSVDRGDRLGIGENGTFDVSAWATPGGAEVEQQRPPRCDRLGLGGGVILPPGDGRGASVGGNRDLGQHRDQ